MAQRRFLLDNDGSNLFHHLGGDAVDVVAAVDETVTACPDNVTTYLVCSGAGACYWPTTVGHVDPRATGLVAAHGRGQDPLRLLLEGLRDAGKETFVSYRMNDVHDPEDADQWNTPRIRREHPDCIVGADEVAAGRASWMAYCLDYARDEVRAFLLRLIDEQLALYGDTIDGLQLDWMRFPRHLSGTPEQVWSQSHVLTDFVAQVRRRCRVAGVALAVRVPPTPAGCRRLGIDLAAWRRDDLIDFVVPCPFLTTDWTVPVADLRALTGDLPVYPGFDFGFGRQIHFPESLRGICSSLHDLGADGIYVFNFPCWAEYLAARPYHWLAGLEAPATAAARPLCLAVNHARHRQPCDGEAQLPATLPPVGAVELRVHVPAAALPARRALCLLEAGGEVTLAVNGVAASTWRSPETSRSPYRGELFVEYPHPEGRARPEDCRTFVVPTEALRPGDNLLEVGNAGAQERQLERLNLGLW